MMDTRQEVIYQKVEAYVYQATLYESSGHDWWHLYRVKELTKMLVQKEGGDIFICQIAALVHDLIDDKLVSDVDKAINELCQQLATFGMVNDEIEEVYGIITKMSFKVSIEKKLTLSLNGQIVQDADRLDAIGAVGIARCMAYSGHHGRVIYDPNQAVKTIGLTEVSYRSDKGDAIGHFYDKLLHLKELMNTKTAREMASQRHTFMENFLDEFYQEWNGVR